MSRAVLSLGANIGAADVAVRAAIDALGPALVRASALYRTPPWGGVEQDDFVNATVLVDDPARDAAGWLAFAREQEAAAQRVREVRWGPRTLDVDIIWIDGVTVDEPDLVIPHPRWSERTFVLAPLADLAPELVGDDVLARAQGQVERVEPLAGWEPEETDEP